MKKYFLSAVFFLLCSGSVLVWAQPELELWRLQCGKDEDLPKAMFSDTFQYGSDATRAFTFSCYLIRHGKDYMLWDAGLPAVDGARITDQLDQIGVALGQIKYLGISHYHFDHIGQAADFPDAKLLIGARDFAGVVAGGTLPDNSTDSRIRLAPWVTGASEARELSGDLDVFDDGTVIVLNTPGHTPGHHSLLIRLPIKGSILLTGDLYHFSENRKARGVPIFNTNRSETLASMDRFEEVAANLKATVIIQHEPSDLAKLPAFPGSAR